MKQRRQKYWVKVNPVYQNHVIYRVIYGLGKHQTPFCYYQDVAYVVKAVAPFTNVLEAVSRVSLQQVRQPNMQETLLFIELGEENKYVQPGRGSSRKDPEVVRQCSSGV